MADNAKLIEELRLAWHVVVMESLTVGTADGPHSDDCPGCLAERAAAALEACQERAEKAEGERKHLEAKIGYQRNANAQLQEIVNDAAAHYGPRITAIIEQRERCHEAWRTERRRAELYRLRVKPEQT